MNIILNATDLDTFASILVSAVGATIDFSANAAYWTACAAEHATFGIDAEAFAPHVLDAAQKAGRLSSPGPSVACWEVMPDGSTPIRLSFSVKVF